MDEKLQKTDKNYGRRNEFCQDDSWCYLIFSVLLSIACEKDHLKIVQYLIENDANIEAKDEEQRLLLFIIMAIYILVTKGAKQSPFIWIWLRKKKNSTPFLETILFLNTSSLLSIFFLHLSNED